MATLPLLEPGIFLHPRPKKLLLSSQPSKRRKLDHKIEQIAFDNDARADYLTGFHKRKVQRAKRAQEEAVKKEREEKVVMRKQVRGFLFSVAVWELGVKGGKDGMRLRSMRGGLLD